MAPVRKQRIARNEAAFRELNETLDAIVHRASTPPDYAGFVCECGDGDCDATVRVPLDAFAAVREDDQLFLVIPGHEVTDAEAVVDEGDGYLVVKKHEDVADVVELS